MSEPRVLLKSQAEGLLALEREANARITAYLRQCAQDLGLNPEEVSFDRKQLSFAGKDGGQEDKQ
jgi:hypothetical protein